jgi:hypothetical protein
MQDEPLTERDIAGHVVLESYEVDLTWDYRLRGMYIEGDGSVWSYNYQGPPFYPEKLQAGELSARDMLNKHKNAERIGSVDPRHLLEVVQLISPASRGAITRASGSVQGSGSLDVAYRFDAESKMYHEVILAGYGEKAATNSAAEAQTLLDYLHEVQQSVGWNP